MANLIDYLKSLFRKLRKQPETFPQPRKPKPAKVPISITINGHDHRLKVEPHRLLVELLREDMKLLGTKRGCEANVCGACTVLLDGKSVHSCCTLAIQADGKSVTTIEGVGEPENLHPVQQAFLDHLGYQCGFCTPGMIMSSIALLNENPAPTLEDIKYALTGNVCRCTGYVKIAKSIQAAAQELQPVLESVDK